MNTQIRTSLCPTLTELRAPGEAALALKTETGTLMEDGQRGSTSDQDLNVHIRREGRLTATFTGEVLSVPSQMETRRTQSVHSAFDLRHSKLAFSNGDETQAHY